MINRTVGFAAVAVLAVSLGACIPVRTSTKRSADQAFGYRPFTATVTAAQTKTGDRLTFPTGRRATLSGDQLLVPELSQNKAAVSLASPLAAADIRKIDRDDKGKIVQVILNDGRVFQVLKSREDESGIRLVSAIPYKAIPLADLDILWVRMKDRGATLIVNSLVWGGIIAAAIVISTSEEPAPPPPPTPPDIESCPFVYSFDGQQYRLDAEPYGGSICPGLERADWVRLDGLEPSAGQYRLKLANELDEIEHVDELKLVVVDHPAGVAVAPGLDGRMRTIVAPLQASSARDASGRDIRPLLRAEDETFWVGRIEGRDPDKDEDLKDELTLEFPRPSGARDAKLVTSAWTTLWGSQAIRPLLETQGEALDPYLAKINAGGPPLLSLMGWFAREEMYVLQARVETGSGWRTRALVYGGGPIIAKEKAYALDLSDVAGDTVKIKLTPAAGFWMIDHVALDFTEDAPIRVTELAASSARDADGLDIRGALAAADGRRFVLPKGSRPAALEFDVPPAAPGLARSVFVKARGYYDILLDAKGAPTLDLEALMNAPGESVRYLLRQHPAIAKPGPRQPGAPSR